jgi:hypothetical protein
MAEEVVHLMTQNHVAIAFPLKTPADAKAMADLRVAPKHPMNVNLGPEAQ